MEYAIRQSAALVNQGAEVHFLCKDSFPKERLAAGISVEILKSGKADILKNARGLLGKILRVWRMIFQLRSQAKQVVELAHQIAQTTSTRHQLPATRHQLGSAEVCVLFACYKEYFAPFWVWPLRRLAKKGVVIGTIAHDPVRDFVVGPLWWHRWSVRLGYSFVRHVFVHDETPVDFGGKRPEGIQVQQIPHGPYEVAEPKIGRLEMRRRLGFTSDLTTIERQGGRENRKLWKAEGRATESWPQRGAASGTMQIKEQPQVGPKGEGVGMTESNNTDRHGYQKTQQGDAQGICAGASELGSLVSELADSPASESLTRSASGPAVVRIAPVGMGSAGGNQLADSKEFLEGQSQAGLQMGLQKLPPPRAAMGSGTSGDNSSSVLIREIRGQKTSGAPEVPSPATSYSPLATPASPDVVFLAFGQIRDGKNLDLFIRAMTQLPENVKLLVAGKGDSGSSKPPEFYQNLAQELGVADRCRWDIRRIPEEEMGDIFAASDVVLVTYSAKFRSASGVLNAAVSARKPVLASSGSGPLKTVVEKYHLGVFVEPDAPEEVFRGAQMILDAVSSSPTQILDTGHSTLDACFPPAWDRYERENSWVENAGRVIQELN